MSTPTTLSDGSVLLPHLANWATPPQCGRRWETAVAGGLTTAEDRQALRQTPLYALVWSVLPFDHAECEKLEAAIRAAKVEGNAATPWWGRGYRVGAAGVAPTATVIPISGLVPSEWLPAVGDKLWAGKTWSTAGGAAWELWTVSAVTPGTMGGEHSITLSAGTALTLAGGLVAVWPLLRGRFSAEGITYTAPSVATYRLRVEQPMGINPGISTSPPIVEAPLQIDGIGFEVIAQEDLSQSVQIDGVGFEIIAMD